MTASSLPTDTPPNYLLQKYLQRSGLGFIGRLCVSAKASDAFVATNFRSNSTSQAGCWAFPPLLGTESEARHEQRERSRFRR